MDSVRENTKNQNFWAYWALRADLDSGPVHGPLRVHRAQRVGAQDSWRQLVGSGTVRGRQGQARWLVWQCGMLRGCTRERRVAARGWRAPTTRASVWAAWRCPVGHASLLRGPGHVARPDQSERTA